jgi:hypothetical protein
MPSLALAMVTAVTLLAVRSEASVAQACVRDTVSAERLGEAMRAALRAPGGAYDLLATTNSMRFQAAVFESLLRRGLADHPAGGVLVIPYDILWSEYLSVADLTASDSNRAPIGRLRAFEYHQSIELDYGPVASLIRRIGDGRPVPVLAANVRFDWPDRADGKRAFSFTDTLSDPKIQATNHQVMTFRFLVFDDMTALEEIEGISGRPLSGFLATIFKVIGEGRAVFARFSISADGHQVLHTKASKIISKTVTTTIGPDGVANSKILEARTDLAATAARLEQSPELEYYPYRCWRGGE